MGVKYKMSFVNAQEIPCVVNFIVDDSLYNDTPIQIFGGSKPFVLSEFNLDNDYFKPIRPQQATIEVLASKAGINIQDFIIENDDRQMKVRFDFGEWIGYWYGILSQEDMSEIWIDQNHILTLRADEGFGLLKTTQLTDFTGQLLSGTYTPYQIIQYASTETVRSFRNTNIISNLFHSSMSSATNTTGLDQCLIDIRTFENSPGTFDDCYTVLEKINRAFNQTIFQYFGEWWIVRQEELFVPKATNIIGFTTNRPSSGNRAIINRNLTASVGINERIKPIMPEGLLTINKPSKTSTIRYAWDDYEQVVVNESFKSGDFLGNIGTPPNHTQRYSVDNWILYDNIDPPSVSSKLFERRVVFDLGAIVDEYIVIQRTGVNVTSYAQSEKLYVLKDSKIDISIQHSYKQTFGANVTISIMQVILYGNDNSIMYLDDNGIFYNDPIRYLNAQYASGTGQDWYDYTVSGNIPKDGYIIFRIIGFADFFDLIYYRNFNVELSSPIQKQRKTPIAGDYDSYTISKIVKNNYDETIFLSDSQSPNYKGTILQTDGITRTSGQWYRRRYPSNIYSFKRHNSVSHWFLNNRSRIKLSSNFYGLLWEDNGLQFPIGLINTINFVNDLPDKKFAIVNLKEIDFMNCTWIADLIEIWDEELDDDVIPKDSDVHVNDIYYN